MNYKMRRFRQQSTPDIAADMLRNGSNGVLSLVDPDGLPYGVPLSYAFDGDSHLYFHSDVKGHKIDCIGTGCLCSFCVVAQDKIVPEEFTSYFRSVIVNGRIHVVDDVNEIYKGLLLLCQKYSPGIDAASEISRCIAHVKLLRLDIESITGKEAIELVRNGANRT